MSNNESTPEIAAALVDDAERLVRLEIALAKQELKEMAISNGIAVGALAGAALLAVLAVFVAVPVLIVVAVEPSWVAALVWIVVYLAGAAGLALFGRSKLRIGLPERTVASFMETREWVRRQMRSPGA